MIVWTIAKDIERKVNNMDELVFNGYDIEYYITEHQKEKERLKEYNSVRIFVGGVEVLEPGTLEIVFYNDKQQNGGE